MLSGVEHVESVDGLPTIAPLKEEKLSEPIYGPAPDYTRVDYMQIHWKRRKQMLAAHPELSQLSGTDSSLAWWTVVLAGAMLLAAWAVRGWAWLPLLALAYLVGAFVDHALWVLIHDLTHNAVFARTELNLLWTLLANVPHVFPSGVSFRYYHRQHHAHLNEAYADPDIPGELEARLFGRHALAKVLWLALFPLMQIARTYRYAKNISNGWMVANYVVNLGAAAGLCWAAGSLRPLVFLLAASLSSIGLHPVGARWLAEHYALCPGQETYSYYGPINQVAFNIGYHNEHHDMPDVPCTRLPQIRATAPEFYSHLYQHPSYLGVLRAFFCDPRFTLRTRVVRSPVPVTTPVA